MLKVTAKDFIKALIAKGNFHLNKYISGEFSFNNGVLTYKMHDTVTNTDKSYSVNVSNCQDIYDVRSAVHKATHSSYMYRAVKKEFSALMRNTAVVETQPLLSLD